MAKFKAMSYNINGARNAAGEVAPDLCAAVIKEQQPDLVMLQRIGSPIGLSSVEHLAERVGLSVYGSGLEGGCVFLSRFPLNYLQEIPLGADGYCLQADLELENERIHLFNLTLSWNLQQRHKQLQLLMGEEFLNNPSLTCATMVCGDFGLPLWGKDIVKLRDNLRRAVYPVWSANFPSKLPLWGRDRTYFRGPIRALDGSIIMTAAAREASSHLPIVLTVETRETRVTLKTPKRLSVSTKQVNPACG